MKTIKVLVFEPMTKPYVKEIEDTLEAKQALVGGLIEPIYFFDDVIIVANEEAKLISRNPANFIIENEAGEIVDTIYGPAFLCCDGEEDFTSITDELVKKYESKFKRIRGMLGFSTFIVIPDEYLLKKKDNKNV